MTTGASGARDLEQAIADLRKKLPGALGPLARLAYNYRWSWAPGGAELFEAVHPERWRAIRHSPVHLLLEASERCLAEAAADRELVARARALSDLVDAERDAPPLPGPFSAERPVAFLCAEYAVHRSLPVYAGGLGALAGDFLKEASDRRLPLVAVGLLYRQGFFHQRLDRSGWQHELWLDADPELLPMVRVRREGGAPLEIEVPIGDVTVRAHVWRTDVGRVPLYLLDAFIPDNPRFERWITARLYEGDAEIRRGQYLLLGVGGIRALSAMGIEPSVVHLNEGHAAFASLELARRAMERGLGFEEAFEEARGRTVFTTHTPVPAGNELYPDQSMLGSAKGLVRALGLSDDAFLALGRTGPGGSSEPFGMTQLALRASRHRNAVSRRHGRVARSMWHCLFSDRAVEDVPIDHVTNGVHVPTWMAPEMRALLDRYLGDGWIGRAADPDTWAGVDRIPDEELWAVRTRLRGRMVEFVRDQSVFDRLARGDPREYVEASERTFDPGVLTLGFARRLATYKRLHLLTRDAPRALRLLVGPRPVQMLIAGKAHPNDEGAKRIVQQQLFPLRGAPEVGQRVAYLEDYDLGTAQELVRGCDLWINLPRPPLEACGTSGMKAALNGCLNLSVLDGWWEEGFDGSNGWAIGGDESHDHGAQDERDAGMLYHLAETEVVPMFHDRDAAGVPRAWVQRIKRSMRTIGPRFCASRMLDDYVRRVYAPA